MRIHLSLLDAHGQTLHEASYDSNLVTVGDGKRLMFAYRELPRIDIETDGYHASARAVSSGAPPQRLLRDNIIPVGNDLRLRVQLFPRPDAVPRRRGACPACGDDLVERRSGGAYRSVATTERGCASCGAVVLTLRSARETHGRFSDRSQHDLVAVTVAGRCPRCLESMTRAIYVFENRQLEVERCRACELVVLDREDQARLGPV